MNAQILSRFGLVAVLGAVLVLSGCGLYRMDVQQGNIISDVKVAQLKRGMSKSAVAALLGTPLLRDDFRQNRWDYVYLYQPAIGATQRKGLVVFFNNAGQVTDIRKE